jgi:uncharacterized membrane protein YfcA
VRTALRLRGVFLISLSSFFTYWTHDHIDWPVVLWLSIGSVAGSLVGAELLNRLSKRTLTIAFIAFWSLLEFGCFSKSMLQVK